LDEVKQMAPGWEHYRAMCDVFPALLDVVEQQHRALNAMLTHMGMDEDDWNKVTFDQARAALSLMDKEKVRYEPCNLPNVLCGYPNCDCKPKERT